MGLLLLDLLGPLGLLDLLGLLGQQGLLGLLGLQDLLDQGYPGPVERTQRSVE